ncbi:sulfotransferase family protein [Streptomyces sp. NPDC056544]|uniref:sulfotransferase family protein n=1 Tax=unclassified Streptomyces TaxID=2593676 RepID=UPI0036B79FD9
MSDTVRHAAAQVPGKAGSQVASQPHYLQFGSLRAWLRLLWRHGASPRYWPRAAVITALSTATAPLRCYERVRFHRAIAMMPPPQAPVFVIGLPRSGTTHLHYLLARDPAVAYMTWAMALLPDLSLFADGRFACLYARWLPPTRGHDHVAVNINAPATEEIALMIRGVDTFLHYQCFPDAFEYYLERATLRGASEEQRERWRAQYTQILNKVSLAGEGRRLLLKNAANTARVGELLTLFPDARFIHIVRNPYEVVASARRLFTVETARCRLGGSPRNTDSDVLTYCTTNMQAYLDQRNLIPPGQLIEIRYEDLIGDPLATVHAIYQRLELPGLDAALPRMREYLASVSGYRRNDLPLTGDEESVITDRLALFFDTWHYPRRK